EGDPASEPLGIAQAVDHGVEGSERGTGRDGRLGHAREDLVDHVALIVEVPSDPLVRWPAARVPGLAIDAVQAPELQAAFLDPSRQLTDQPEVLPLVEASHGGGEDQEGHPSGPKAKGLHLSAQGRAPVLEILPVQLRGESIARSSAPPRAATEFPPESATKMRQ